MEILLIGAWIAVLVGPAVWRTCSRAPERSRWLALVKMCGLTEARFSRGFTQSLSARQGDLQVVFEAYNRFETFDWFKAMEKGRTTRAARVTVRGISPSIDLKREWLATRIGKAIGQTELDVGDPAFDRSFCVRGSESVLRAVLDSQTRALLVDAFAGRVVPSAFKPVEMTMEIHGGEIVVEFADDVGANAEPFPETVRCLLALASRLKDPDDVLSRLAENAERDPLPAVRRKILSTLERTALGEPATRAAMKRAAREDTDGSVRLQAALWLGPYGIPTLEALAIDGAVEDAVSARAIEELGEHWALDRARRVLQESMAAGRSLTATAAAVVLGRCGETEVEPLAAALKGASGDLAVALARALGRTGSERAEGPLLAALGREGEHVQAAAAAALGHVGTAESVLPLAELAQSTRGIPFEAALGALALIRKRLTGADPGRLSMAEGTKGELTLADDAQGRVTLPDPDERS